MKKAVDAAVEFPGKDEARRRLAILAIEPRSANAADHLAEHVLDTAQMDVCHRLDFFLRSSFGLDPHFLKMPLLTAAPNYAPALNNFAVLNSEQFGQLDAASDLAKRAREAAPNEPHIADTFGWILFKRGEYSDATGSRPGLGAARRSPAAWRVP